MIKAGTCAFCGKQCPSYQHYCDWNCIVEDAKKDGGKVHCPNGLPIKSVDRDGNMWEHEHGDHPNYMFPVDVDYVGQLDDRTVTDYRRFVLGSYADDTPLDEAKVRQFHGERHALVFTDGVVALTMYECCYSLWSVHDGSLLRVHLWYTKEDHRLSEASLKNVRNRRYEV